MFDFQQSHVLEDHEQLISQLLSPPVVNNFIQFSPDTIHLLPPPQPAGNGGDKKRSKEGGGKKRSRSTPTNDDDEKNVKKITHREIEKQRRQEMAKLYASLRSLLPLEYVKGKRSISDHMHQAVIYINNLQKKISQLRSKNPNLSTSSSGGNGNNGSAESCTNRLAMNILGSTVTINMCGNGILETLIRINNRKDDEVFPISRMIMKMVSEGLNVTSYVSSKTQDDATLYSFISEVDDPSCIDINKLQKTLMDVIM